MKGKRLSPCFANKVYDILVEHAGVLESGREHFLYVSCDEETFFCNEFRFGGKFGFGGKYWSERNAINYYQEDRNKKLDALEAKINKLLGEIKL